jgi:hypothetical protein
LTFLNQAFVHFLVQYFWLKVHLSFFPSWLRGHQLYQSKLIAFPRVNRPLPVATPIFQPFSSIQSFLDQLHHAGFGRS